MSNPTLSNASPPLPEESDADPHDLLVIGGGINGAGIARDAAGRGAKVLLVEKDDLASHTSSASTKLIHGGLRYLENFEFRLVREALSERECLLKIAPHIIWPMRFILPHSRILRPAWLLRLGLFLYDHLTLRMTLPKTRSVRLQKDPSGSLLKPRYVQGFEYSDGWVQDSRLVILNALDAARRGAKIFTRTKFIRADRQPDFWTATLKEIDSGKLLRIQTRAIVNAAGPWVTEILGAHLRVRTQKSVRLVKGSHIVVPKLYDTPKAFILQNPDRRIVFVIPFEENYTLIGTTDIPWERGADDVQISPKEKEYLCESVNRYFRKTVAVTDIVWSYAGVRPLYDDHAHEASSVTRDYKLDLDREGAPVLSVFGGKITTHRKLAEHALEALAPSLPHLSARKWTATQPLPGGTFERAHFDREVEKLMANVKTLTKDTAQRLIRNYGTCAHDFMTSKKGSVDKDERIGADLYEREVAYLIDHEFARTADDILWRRSKLGLGFTDTERERLSQFMANYQSHRSSVVF